MNLLNIISFALAVVAYTISQLIMHAKLKWSFNEPTSYWGAGAWRNKYKFINNQFVKPPQNWYYKFFRIYHKERFPFSATALVFLTDGYHFCQLLFKLFLILSLVTYEPIFNMVWDFIIYFLLFGLTFTITYKFLSK